VCQFVTIWMRDHPSVWDNAGTLNPLGYFVRLA
jgi:hypothetical protein